jgi:hypothetical protein
MIADAPLSLMPLKSVAPVCCEARECKCVAVWCVVAFTGRDRAVGATGEGAGAGTGKDRGTGTGTGKDRGTDNK